LIFATSPSNAIESLIVILLLALVHLFVRELRRIEVASRKALLSAGAGASLAYVLVLAGVVAFTVLLLILEQMPQTDL
jgi:hypothetical protein